MVSIAPPLKAALELRLQIENGISVAESIRNFSRKHIDDSFAKELGHWLFLKETGQKQEIKSVEKLYRQSLLDILSRGLEGEPILENLKDLEQDLCIAADEDLEKYLQKLPFISLIPLLLFQFPAFIFLLLGPLVLDLLSIL